MRTLFCVVVLTCTISCQSADDNGQAKIDSLVSKNPPTKGTNGEELPQGWSDEEDRRVRKAFDAICLQGRSLVPALIENLERKEFSTYTDSAIEFSPVCVGEMCRWAFAEWFDPIGIRHKSRRNNGQTLMGVYYFDVTFTSRKAASEWWEKNRDKSTVDIRTMVRQWYIDRETAFGFESEDQKKHTLDEIEALFKRNTQK